MNAPKPMSKHELLVVLCDMLSSVIQDDTLEGTITYSASPGPNGDGDFMVSGAYRVGNKDGQGGVHIISGEAL